MCILVAHKRVMSVQTTGYKEDAMNVSEVQPDDEGTAVRLARSERFMSILKRHQIPKHGAQTIMAKETGVSDATIAAWMRGSLPRDPVVLITFCDIYDVDLYWWVNGSPRPMDGISSEKLVRADQTVRKWTDMHGINIEDGRRMVLVAKVYNDPAMAQEYLASMLEILSY